MNGCNSGRARFLKARVGWRCGVRRTASAKKDWCRVAAVSGASFLLFTGSGMCELASETGSAPRVVEEWRKKQLAVSDLPVVVQGKLSRVLGRESESYHVRARSEGSFEAQNIPHGVRAVFRREGVQIAVAEGTWHFRWVDTTPSENAQDVQVWPFAVENRVEYRREHVVEWYINGPLGIQQGFTVAERLAGSGGRAGLRVELEQAGTLRAEVDESGHSLLLRKDDGTIVLAYRGLTAWDAKGRELPARLRLTGNRLAIEVDDAGAQYPITIDPFLQQAKLKASRGGPFDDLGYSVAIDGDTVVVGAPNNANRGAAYVFVKSAAGWGNIEETAKLTASDGDASDLRFSNAFGRAVAISGDTVVVGADGMDTNGNADQGAAYVFVKPSGGWRNMNETAKLVASDGGALQRLGSSVAIDGDTVVVGAIGADADRGAAYVFMKPLGGWSGIVNETAKLTPQQRAQNDLFGTSVAVHGDSVVVGATWVAGRGAGYVFVKPPGGWVSTNESAKLIASDGAYGDTFGESVAIDAETIVVGAPHVDLGGNSSQGAAYLFVKPSGGWSGTLHQNAKLTASDGGAIDYFGRSVSISGSAVVVGAEGVDNGANLNQGAAYVFVKPPGGWANMNETAKLTASDGTYGDSFGSSVAIRGNTIVVGAYLDDFGSGFDRGSAYVFVDYPVLPNCPGVPASGCDAPVRASIFIKDHVSNSAKDRFKLKLARNNPARDRSQLGDPTGSAIYTVCIWSGTSLIAQLQVPASGNWSLAGQRGYSYKDVTLARDGVRSAKVIAGSLGRPRTTTVIVSGQGENLPDPALPLSSPVSVAAQWIDLDSGICFGQTFTDAHVRSNGANATGTIRTFRAVKKPE